MSESNAESRERMEEFEAEYYNLRLTKDRNNVHWLSSEMESSNTESMKNSLTIKIDSTKRKHGGNTSTKTTKISKHALSPFQPIASALKFRSARPPSPLIAMQRRWPTATTDATRPRHAHCLHGDSSSQILFRSKQLPLLEHRPSTHQIRPNTHLPMVKNYNIARSIILDATDKASNSTVTQMTNLLGAKATRARTIAANDTFFRNSSRWATPMDEERMKHFRKYLAELTQEPILTQECRFPSTLNRRFMTREEIEDEQQTEIGNMAPPPLHSTTF
jgi:hypothetical protein